MPGDEIIQIFLKTSIVEAQYITVDIRAEATISELLRALKDAISTKLLEKGVKPTVALQCSLDNLRFTFAGKELDHNSVESIKKRGIDKESTIHETKRIPGSILSRFAARLGDHEKILDSFESVLSINRSNEEKREPLSKDQNASLYNVYSSLQFMQHYDFSFDDDGIELCKKAILQVSGRYQSVCKRYNITFNPTLIKYYNFQQDELETKGTCYDGVSRGNGASRDFIKPSAPIGKRFYPDEYLIAHILNKYVLGQPKIFTLTEPWKENGGTRDGIRNEAINTQILNAIEKYKETNALILAPFLYGYHHPGVVIDTKNKHVIYIDPFGREPSYPETKDLFIKLKELGYKCEFVSDQQQAFGLDGTSCGPILTTSMIKLVDEYIEKSCITVNGFSSRGLATERMYQVFINNTTDIQDMLSSVSLHASHSEQLHIDEIMLADIGLWQAFLKERNVNDSSLVRSILNAVNLQKLYLKNLEDNWENNQTEVNNVHFIKEFQSSTTNNLLRMDPNNRQAIETLVSQSNSRFTNSRHAPSAPSNELVRSESKDYNQTSNFYVKNNYANLLDIIVRKFGEISPAVSRDDILNGWVFESAFLRYIGIKTKQDANCTFRSSNDEMKLPPLPTGREKYSLPAENDAASMKPSQYANSVRFKAKLTKEDLAILQIQSNGHLIVCYVPILNKDSWYHVYVNKEHLTKRIPLMLCNSDVKNYLTKEWEIERGKPSGQGGCSIQ